MVDDDAPTTPGPLPPETPPPEPEAVEPRHTFPLEIRLGGGKITLYADGTTDMDKPEKLTKELSRMKGQLTNEMLFAFVLLSVARLNAELDEITNDVD